MASNAAFFRGQNCALRLYQNGKSITVMGKNFDVEENASENNDGVNGEYRDRVDKTTNYFTCTVDLFQNDQEQMDMMLAAQDVDDAAGFQLKQSAAVQIQQRDGTRAAYLLQECRFGPWKQTYGGRDEAVMMNLKIRCRYVRRVQAI